MKPGKRSKKNKIGEPFVPVLKRMINSPAYKRLSNASRVAYLLLKAQCNENGQREIKFPYRDAQLYMKPSTFSRSIKQLEELGFIEKTQYGGLYRRTNVYRLIEKWREVK